MCPRQEQIYAVRNKNLQKQRQKQPKTFFISTKKLFDNLTIYYLTITKKTIDKYRAPAGNPILGVADCLVHPFLVLRTALVSPFLVLRTALVNPYLVWRTALGWSVNPLLVEYEAVEGFVLGLGGEGDHALRHLGRVMQTFTRPLGNGGELLAQCQLVLGRFGATLADYERVSNTGAVSVRILTLGETVTVAPG